MAISSVALELIVNYSNSTRDYYFRFRSAVYYCLFCLDSVLKLSALELFEMIF